ncbi:hypothetical protein K0M31_014225, partial [Melipona bicolor]
MRVTPESDAPSGCEFEKYLELCEHAKNAKKKQSEKQFTILVERRKSFRSENDGSRFNINLPSKNITDEKPLLENASNPESHNHSLG